MNEYEVATLGIREAGLWIAGAHVAVGLIQAAVVWHGIRAMRKSGDSRAREHDDRHVETMRALEALIERTAPARG